MKNKKIKVIMASGYLGSGKTTFINNLSGIYSPTTGQFIFNDEDITAFINIFFNHYHPNNQTLGKINYFRHPSKLEYTKITIELPFGEIGNES